MRGDTSHGGTDLNGPLIGCKRHMTQPIRVCVYGVSVRYVHDLMTSGWGVGGGGEAGDCVENLRGCTLSVLCIPTTDTDFYFILLY